jgi:acyl carrier protein
MENFETGMAELLEVDSVKDTDVLQDFEAWDSLTSLSIIAFIDENYKVSVSAKDLVDARTVGGLKEWVAAKYKK